MESVGAPSRVSRIKTSAPASGYPSGSRTTPATAGEVWAARGAAAGQIMATGAPRAQSGSHTCCAPNHARERRGTPSEDRESSVQFMQRQTRSWNHRGTPASPRDHLREHSISSTTLAPPHSRPSRCGRYRGCASDLRRGCPQSAPGRPIDPRRSVRGR